MAIDDNELLAAVSGGIDSVPSAPADTSTPETTTDETVAEETDLGADATGSDEGDTGTEAGEGKDGDSGPPSEGESDSAEAEIGPDGKPVAKRGDEPDAPAEVDPATGKPFTPEQIAAKKAKEDFAKAQIEDPVNAPIPKYLKETTQKRMTKLVEIAKELTAKHESMRSDRNEIIGMITKTGATATQYTSALKYLEMVNSRDPAKMRQAIGVMQAELTALSRMAGVPVAGVDHLAKHADLKTAVDAKQITQELAEEIAAGREQRSFQSQQQQVQQQTTQQAKAAHAAGVRSLNDIGKRLAAQDPNYRTKATAVLDNIKGEMQKLPPAQWAQAFLVAYSTYQPPAASAATVRKAPVVPKNQPLRGNNPSGGQQSAPKSLEDAINLGIAAGTRR